MATVTKAKATAKTKATTKTKVTTKAKATGASMDPDAVQLARAFDRGFCVQITVGGIGVRRRMSTDEIAKLRSENGDAGAEEGAVDKGMLRLSKVILQCDEYDAVQRAYRAMKTVLDRAGIQTILGKALYLIPARTYTATMSALDKKIAEWEASVDAFCEHYAESCITAKRRLGPLFDESEYPPPAQIRHAFYTKVRRGFKLVVDDRLRIMDAAAYDAAVAAEVAEKGAAAREFRDGLRQALSALVSHLVERLSVDASGKMKVLRPEAIERVTDWLNAFDDKNLTDDTALKTQADKVRALLVGVDVDTLRSDDLFRAHVAAQVQKVGMTLVQLVQDAPARKMRWQPRAVEA
jgi:hypothetical protein